MSRFSRVESLEETSFTNSIERSVGAADATLQHLASAKETFGDLEAAYRTFKHELEIVKTEHATQVNQLQTRIENLQKAKGALDDQLSESKAECKKYQEELVTIKRTLAERDWEKENLEREVASCKNVTNVVQKEKEELEKEFAHLQRELSSSSTVLVHSNAEENEQLLAAKQEAAQWEESYNCLLQEKEVFQNEFLELQDKLAGIQAEYEKSQRELMNCNKNYSIKVSKLEMQLQNTTKQRENFKTQLVESREELRKNKETHSLLQKDIFEVQKEAEDSKGELATKTRQVEKLETANKDLLSKIEDLKEQLSKQRMSIELHATQSKVVETEMNLSQVKITELDTSLQSAKNERDDLQRELFAVSSKLVTMEEANKKSLDKVAELDMENSRLRDNIAGLESEMFAQGRKFSQFEPTYAQARDEIEQLTVKLEESSIRISQLESSYETAIRERDDLTEELALSERRLTETKFLLQKTEDVSNEVEQKMAAMKSQMFKCEGQIESASKQKSSLKAELEEERSKVTRLKKKLAKAQSRHEEFQRNVDFNKKESSNKDKIIEDLRASVAAYELKTESLFSEVSKLQAQMEITEEEKRELQEETLDAEKRIRDVTVDNRQSSEENEKLNLEIQGFYKRLSELQASFNTCEHEKYDFQHQAMALQQKVTKLEAELDETINQRSVYEVRVQEFTATNNTISQEVALLKTQLLEQQRINDNLRKEIAEGEASSKQLHEKLNALNVDFDACREELKNMKGMREMSEKEKKMLHNQLMIKQEEHSRAQGLYETTLKRKEQIETELNEAQKRMANMESSLKRSVAADKARELDHERSRSTELAKQLASYKSKVSSLESNQLLQRTTYKVFLMS
ncbi:hypothetical protein ACROYT_G027410 [Oculina patagonica]